MEEFWKGFDKRATAFKSSAGPHRVLESVGGPSEGSFWKGFDKRASFLPAGLVHLMQNVGFKKLLHTPAYGNQMAKSFQEGYLGKAPGKIQQFMRGVAGGGGIPETSALTNHAYEVGSGFAKALRERGITHLTPRDMLMFRHLSRGEFATALRRAPRAMGEGRLQALLDVFSSSTSLPAGALHPQQSSGVLQNLESAWKSPKNPWTSNILSRATDKFDKAKANYPAPAIVPAAHEPLAYKTQLAGASVGSALVGALDPFTAGLNFNKMVLTNPGARAAIEKVPFAGKMLQKTDNVFLKNPITAAAASGAHGLSLSSPKQLLSTYGLNAPVATLSDSANRLGKAMRKKANEDPLAFWDSESKEEDKKAKNVKKVVRVSPVELSQGFAPDTWPRYWP